MSPTTLKPVFSRHDLEIKTDKMLASSNGATVCQTWIGRAGTIIIKSITETMGYWRRYKRAQHSLLAVPECVLRDLGISQKQIPAVAGYAAVAQIDIAAAINHFAGRPTAPLPVLNTR
jgi:uncharacterized protein YjiS (DUF1127 family)